MDGDIDELRAAVLNLIDNAVKYSREPVHVTVEVAAPAPDTGWVRVRDAASASRPHELKRIFSRFYRFPARGYRVKGTGLGLFIVRTIAKQHGGRVFAESAGPGRGTHLHAASCRVAARSA